MKMGKRVLSIILSFCLMIPLMAISVSADEVASGSCGDNVKWKITGTEITYKDGEKVGGYTLTISGSGEITIGDDALNAPWKNYIFHITNIVIEDGITVIGKNAFFCCSAATKATIPNSVTTIGENAFWGCNLTEITIPDSVKTIDKDAFHDCNNLTELTIPKSVTSIGVTAFFTCRGLTEINVEDGNPNYTSVDGILYTKDKSELIVFPMASEARTLEIAKNTTIDPNAIRGTVALTEINVEDGNPNYTSIDGVLFSKDKTKLILYPSLSTRTSYAIPENVKTIEDYAFSGCAYLTELTIPESVTTIGVAAFMDSKAITELTIPKGVADIDISTFQACRALTKLTISAASTVQHGAFASCPALTEVTFKSKAPEIKESSNIFMWSENLKAIYVPKGCAEEYKELFAKTEQNANISSLVKETNETPAKQAVSTQKDDNKSSSARGKGAPIVPIIIVVVVVVILAGVIVVVLKKKK